MEEEKDQKYPGYHRVKITPKVIGNVVMHAYVSIHTNEKGETEISPLYYNHVDKAKYWATQHAKKDWKVNREFMYFEDKEDAALFTMFWDE